MREVREHPPSFLSLSTGGECRGDRGEVAAEDFVPQLAQSPSAARRPELRYRCFEAAMEKGGDTSNYGSNSGSRTGVKGPYC